MPFSPFRGDLLDAGSAAVHEDQVGILRSGLVEAAGDGAGVVEGLAAGYRDQDALGQVRPHLAVLSRVSPDVRPSYVAASVDRAQESTMFVGSGIETAILAGFARGMAQFRGAAPGAVAASKVGHGWPQVAIGGQSRRARDTGRGVGAQGLIPDPSTVPHLDRVSMKPSML